MKSYEVLLPTPLNPMILAAVETRYTAHRLYEAREQDAMLADIGPRIRALVTGGPDRRRIDAALMEHLPKLEFIAHLGVGYDQIDAAWAAARGIVISHTPDVLNEEVADLAMGLLLATVRQIPQADAYLRAGHWPRKTFPLTASLQGRTLGILGLGRIGRAIARRAEPFGLRICYHSRRPVPEVGYAYHADAVALASACDILMVVAPATADTRHLVNASVLEALGRDGILINVARGSLVDEEALTLALREGVILGAGLDVFANEPHVPEALTALDNVVLLPHVGSASHVTRTAMSQLVLDNLAAWIEGRGPVTPVPETPWPRSPML
jgi:lactate dehydrogenase-like 2-hydroxyacid dehydrogenase